MIKVVGTWEFGWNTPIKEFDLWAFPLRDLGVDEYIMYPKSGIQAKVTEFNDLDEVIEVNSGLTPVYIDEHGETPLTEFEHPKNALYICGKASYSPYMSKKKNGVISVKIETVQNKALLWGHQAACLVLYDRMIKNGNSGN